ncbi:MAG: helix-turn-helix domain-containing protein [Clostridia bacterium]|nr:helix-turn-helix domain-containing protein [Clostridia bacterium]
MYAKAAYLNNSLDDTADLSEPLVVKSCGNYRLLSRKSFVTYRPSGRRDFQLLYIASGKAHFFFNNEEKLLPAGTMVLYRPDEEQNYTYYLEDKPEVFWVHFTGFDAENILAALNLKSNIFFTGVSTDFNLLFQRIISEIQSSESGSCKITPLILQNILCLIERYALSSVSKANTTKKEIELAIQFFSENYSRDIDIKEYAASRHISLCWFIRSFKKYTGLSPMQYILSMRITNAKYLLENTQYNVSEISSIVGYENSLYFSRIFKKNTGFSPTEYRKKFCL